MSNLSESKEVDVVNCPSSWQSNRSCQETSSQTAHTQVVDTGSQSRSTNSAEVQTEPTQQSGSVNVDLTRLGAWLTKVTPRVLEELDKNRNSHVFDDYKLKEAADSTVKHLYTIGFQLNPPQQQFVTSGIGWSSTGGMLAVSRCAKEHSSWCDHPGEVCLYQTNRQESNPDIPNRSLNVSCCVTSLCTHPNDSFILACGTFSGEVVVWNLQRDDATVIGSSTFHSEAVIHMEWIQNFDMTSGRPALASVSRDGTVIIWTVKSMTSTLKASLCFLLQAEKEDLDLGIACAQFNPCNPSQFLTGLEGGSIAICSTGSKRPCLRKQKSVVQELECYDPVLNILEGHRGNITGVKWVPDSKDLFISCSTDAELHVYSLTDLSLMRIIHLPEPSYGLEISSSHSNIAATWGSSGAVHLHNVLTSKMLPALDLKEEEKNAPLSVIHFRTTSSQLLALGNALGRVSVWQIPHSKFSILCES